MGNSFSVTRFGELVGIDFLIQLVGWSIAAFLRTERFYDLTGSLTYWMLVLRALSFTNHTEQRDGRPTAGAISSRQWVCALAVLAWSLRLGTFLARRGWKYGDSRFDKVKHQPATFLIYYLVQGLWCLLTPLPVYLVLTQRRQDSKPLECSDFASWAGWLIGFALEVVADRQKTTWKDAGNKNFMQTGLFHYSQHPNYFGEMLLWASLYVSCANGLEGWAPKLISLASPAFVIYMLRFVSGVPMLQNAAQRKYGKDPLFVAYRSQTSLLVPWPARAT